MGIGDRSVFGTGPGGVIDHSQFEIVNGEFVRRDRTVRAASIEIDGAVGAVARAMNELRSVSEHLHRASDTARERARESDKTITELQARIVELESLLRQREDS